MSLKSNFIYEKHRNEYSNILIFVKQTLNNMKVQDLLEFLREIKENK